MNILPKSIEKLIEEFKKLPGVGPKTASRYAFNILNWEPGDIEKFADTLQIIKNGIGFCNNCFTMSESNICDICKDPTRDKKTIAVVEKPLDVIAIESTGDYQGLYHVLGGAIEPIEGVGPQNLKIEELINRIKKNNVSEIILATNPNLEGETTSMYVAKRLKDLNVSITRIARGIPIGGELEYIDEGTLSSAMAGRQKYGK